MADPAMSVDSEAQDRGRYLPLMDRWAEYEAVLRKQAYRTIESDPQVLLEHDSGGPGIAADLIYARLLGYDDEIVQDGWRLRRIEPVLLLPIFPRMSLAESDVLGPGVTRSATYALQSGYALVSVHAEVAMPPAGVRVGPDGTFRVLYLRYRRRG